MTDTPKLYIAGMGMVTPVGGNVAMTAAAVDAGISGYSASNYETLSGEKITTTKVPNSVFDQLQVNISGGNIINLRNERIIRMMIIALREAVCEHHIDHPIPCILAVSDAHQDTTGFNPVIPNIVKNVQPWIHPQLTRRLASGRAVGMEALSFVFNYLLNEPQEFLLVGAADSYEDDDILQPLINSNRLLYEGAPDSFAPGEGASALLLTPHIELALIRDGHAIALNPPSVTDEPGHLSSARPYRGEGLDKAFKLSLCNQTAGSIHSIYSSMNGENHWAKEYGVAYLRNKEKFAENVKIKHPADCYGDLGAATSTTLIALAVEHLYKSKSFKKTLVYSSSDNAQRGAIVLEKIALNTTA